MAVDVAVDAGSGCCDAPMQQCCCAAVGNVHQQTVWWPVRTWGSSHGSDFTRAMANLPSCHRVSLKFPVSPSSVFEFSLSRRSLPFFFFLHLFSFLSALSCLGVPLWLRGIINPQTRTFQNQFLPHDPCNGWPTAVAGGTETHHFGHPPPVSSPDRWETRVGTRTPEIREPD